MLQRPRRRNPLPPDPNGHHEQFSQKFLKTIAQVLVDTEEGQWKPGRDGRRKVRFSCLWHDDPNPSCDYYPDDGWCYCQGCSSSYSTRKLAEALDIETPRPLQKPGRLNMLEIPGPFYQKSLGNPDEIYPYYWPNGQLSHFKLRWGHGKSKQIRWMGPDLQWRKPETWWPIYGQAPPPGANIVLCEGEKAVNRINQAREIYDGAPIVAMTAGSKEDCLNAVMDWSSRLVELKPARVLVWPDRDLRMAPWSKRLFYGLRELGVTTHRLDPKTIYPEIPPGGGPDDFLENGGTLERAFSWRFSDALSNPKVVQFLDDLEIVEGDRVRIPHTRALRPLRKENLGAFWFAMHGTSIPRGSIDPIFDQLLSRDPSSFTEVCHRRWNDGDCTTLVWRGDERAKAVVVDRAGVRFSEDPDRVLIRCHKLPPGSHGIQVDMEGQLGDLDELCALYGLDEEHSDMIEGWLACAMIGLETPILLLRGEAGTGKTTFGKALLSVLEPACPGLQLDDDRNIDTRELNETLRQSVGVIMDNVGNLHANAENRLCRVVTGDSTSQRRLYTTEIDMFALRRAIVMTSISWEPRKSDLRARILPLTLPVIESYFAEATIAEKIRRLLPKIRGYLFNRIARYYQQAPKYHGDGGELRIADWGRYLGVMGVDTTRLAELVRLDRREQLDEGDNWVQAVVDFQASHWKGKSPKKGDFFRSTGQEIISFMRQDGIEPPYNVNSSYFRKWLEENNPRWREYGFNIKYLRSNAFRGYDFRVQ